MASHKYKPRVNQGGNFCGHYPFAPRLELKVPAKHPQDPEFKKIGERAWAHEDKPGKQARGGIPLVIARCIERIPQYYSSPRRVLPSLDLANGSDRQQRSERRESCICVLAAVLKYCDLASLRVGIPTKEGFKSLTVKYLASQTFMSLKRVERAMADLKAAGLLTVSQPRQLLPDGRWVGLAAVKAVNKALFEVFGLGSMLKMERDKAAKRLKIRASSWEAEDNKPSRSGRARFSLFLGGKAGGDSPKEKRHGPSPETLELEKKKLLSTLAAKIKLENPKWNSKECFDEAERKLQGDLFGMYM